MEAWLASVVARVEQVVGGGGGGLLSRRLRPFHFHVVRHGNSNRLTQWRGLARRS